MPAARGVRPPGARIRARKRLRESVDPITDTSAQPERRQSFALSRIRWGRRNHSARRLVVKIAEPRYRRAGCPTEPGALGFQQGQARPKRSAGAQSSVGKGQRESTEYSVPARASLAGASGRVSRRPCRQSTTPPGPASNRSASNARGGEIKRSGWYCSGLEVRSRLTEEANARRREAWPLGSAWISGAVHAQSVVAGCAPTWVDVSSLSSTVAP